MLFEPLFAHAQRQPEALAIVDDRGRYTYAQVAAMAGGMSVFLGMQTSKPRVGIMLPAGAGFVACFYGALLAGKAVVPLNFLLGDKEIAHCIADSGIDTIVTIPLLAGRLKDIPVKVIDLSQLPPPPAGGAAAPPNLPTPAADDLAVLMYTSGTSGLPKGVLLTYGNLQSNVDAAITHVDFKTSHRFLGMIPLFHIFGMGAMMLIPMQLGAMVVYMGRFSPVAAVHAIREHGISLLLGVPSMFAAIARLKDASAEDFKTLYAMLSGGEPMPPTVGEAFRTRFHAELYEAYGMTETSLAISANTPQRHKPGSVGTAVPKMEIIFVDDAGHPVARGAEGEIWVRGPMVLKGYNNLPIESAAAITPEGFFKTGDLGRIDADGFIYITGRKKDLIIIAGEKASPREIEEMLLKHPTVLEAAVVGKKDANRGEVVAAYVIAREGQTPDADKLREFCRQQGLAQWKMPRQINVVADFPRSPTGKVLKRVLAAQENA